MKSKATRLLVRNVFHLGIGQIALTALGILLNVVIARALGAAEFGVLYFINTISAFLYVIMDWGQSTYLIREVARGRVDESELIGGALLIRLATIACASAIALAVTLVLGYDKQIVFLTILAVM